MSNAKSGRRSMGAIQTDDKQRWENYVTKWEWDDKGNFQLARFFGDIVTDVTHTVKTKTGKNYPEFCHGWDVDNNVFYKDREARCPCCALNLPVSFRYFLNAIDIAEEEAKPAKPKPGWSPIRFVAVPKTLFARLKDLVIVNKGHHVTEAEHGAIVQIKFNPKLEASSQYTASMDTKDVAITDEQKSYTVTQSYPDGSTKVIHSDGVYPAQFEYIRCVNSRDDMIKSLRRNGYYGDTDSASHSFENKSLSREENVARVDAEAPIETMDVDLDTLFPGTSSQDEAPAPKTKTTVEAPAKSVGPYEECMTEFGKFSSHMDCFTKCGVWEQCKAKTDAAAASPVSAPSKKKVIIDEDDDTV